ncbi:MAG: cytochrome-c peroxidase, partial [Pseudomonadota bacterium]
MFLRTLLTGALLSAGVVTAQEAATPQPPIEVDAARAELGKRLFYDTRLSGDTSVSCASCHQPDKAFTDGQPLSDA